MPKSFKNTHAGFILGGVKFVKDKLNQLKGEIKAKDFAYKRAIRNIIEPQTIINAVADYFKISYSDLCCLRKRPSTLRQIAIYLLKRKTGLTNAQIGSLFMVKHSAVSMAALSFGKEIEKDEKLKSAVDKINWNLEVCPLYILH